MEIEKAIDTAVAYYKAGKLQEAKDICRNVLKIHPYNIPLLKLLGEVCYQTKDYDCTILCMKQILEIHQKDAEVYNKLGLALQGKGYIEEAGGCYQKAIAINPENAESHYNLAFLLQGQGRHKEAISYFQRTLELNPDHLFAYYGLGVAFTETGQLDEAITAYQRALKLYPLNALAYINLGRVFHDKGFFDEAISAYQEAIKLNPMLADAYHHKGYALYRKNRLDEAISCFKKAIAINPDDANLYNSLGIAVRDRGQLVEAEEYFRRALQIKPDSVIHSNILSSMNYNYRYDAQTIFSEHLRFAKQHAQLLSSVIFPHSNERLSNRPLRIGYVSPDFKRHPVACFIEPVLMAHNHEQFEIFCYSDVPSHDEVTRRIKSYANQWRNIVGMSDENVAELIRNDVIDILIDLAGHTANNRILLFARKPAPVQVSWIGYLATTGLSAMDYRIADMYTDPPGMTERYYTEKLLRLPESFLCYLPDRDSPGVGPLPALTTGHITFGSFNNFAKITHEVFSLWAQILKAVSDSRLIMKWMGFSDKMTCEYAITMFTKKGINAERIILQSWDLSPKHLESYNLVDVGLDTFPFNGAATTCEALWMGVPVITLAGAAYHSRAGISLLSNAGLPELVAKTSDEYISIAVNLSRDLKRLQSLREHLRDMMTYSPLCDARRFTAHIEKCYREIWKKWCINVVR